MSHPSLSALQGFVAAARHGNLSRAAQSMHITVSALSHQMRGLEERLGQRLFVRTARGVELTADGQQLFERVASHLDAIEDALCPYRVRRDDVLTLTVMPSFASSWLVPRLPRFLAAQPQLEINLSSSVGLVDFERETSVDAGVRFGGGSWRGLQAVHLFDDWMTPVASPALLERLGRPTLHNLQDFPLLGVDRWAEWFERHGGAPPRRFVASFDDAETLQRAAAEGLGIALGRLTLVRPHLEAGRLVRLFPERLPSQYAHYLVYPPRSEGHAGLALFRAWLLEEARCYGALDAAPPPQQLQQPTPPPASRRGAGSRPRAR